MEENNNYIEQFIIFLDEILDVIWRCFVVLLKGIALLLIRTFISLQKLFNKTRVFIKNAISKNKDKNDLNTKESVFGKYFSESFLEHKIIEIKEFSSKTFSENKKTLTRVLAIIIIGAVAVGIFKFVGREKPMKMNAPHNIHGIVNMRRTFNDLNPVQLKAAKKLGITPLKDRGELPKVKKDLRHIKSCELYKIDRLTHSVPYLVPKSEKLLNDIGQNFKDSLKNKGLNPNCIIVTSLLRTRKDQQKLSRRNVNATNVSTHMFATTFDISYKRFHKLETSWGTPNEDVDAYTMKLVLSEVLYDLRKLDRCYVKYEVKQGCFHITAR